MRVKREHLQIALAAAFIVLVVSYVGVYFVLSRNGFRAADKYEFEGFYFVEPDGSKSAERAHEMCVTIFKPLLVIDKFLGTGQSPGNPPLFGLEFDDNDKAP